MYNKNNVLSFGKDGEPVTRIDVIIWNIQITVPADHKSEATFWIDEKFREAISYQIRFFLHIV